MKRKKTAKRRNPNSVVKLLLRDGRWTISATGNKQWAGPMIQQCLDHKLITQEDADALRRGRSKPPAPVAPVTSEAVRP
jgi:hypothetical protein